MEGCVTIIRGDISRECAGLEDEKCEDGMVMKNSELGEEGDVIGEWG